MERRILEIEVAAPDPSLRQPASEEEIARRQEVWRETMELRETAPKTDKPIVEIIRELREAGSW